MPMVRRERAEKVASCRESYGDAERRTHLDGVDAPLEGVLDGPSTSCGSRCVQSECDKLKEALSPLGCVFYVTDWGFRNAHPQGAGRPRRWPGGRGAADAEGGEVKASGEVGRLLRAVSARERARHA